MNMTKFEVLENKINALHRAAMSANNSRIREVWVRHWLDLKAQLRGMLIINARTKAK